MAWRECSLALWIFSLDTVFSLPCLVEIAGSLGSIGRVFVLYLRMFASR